MHDDTGRPPLLTDGELRVLAAVEDLSLEHGYAPTYSQLLDRIGWRSRGTLSRYLERLRQKGAISGRGRALHIQNPNS